MNKNLSKTIIYVIRHRRFAKTDRKMICNIKIVFLILNARVINELIAFWCFNCEALWIYKR